VQIGAGPLEAIENLRRRVINPLLAGRHDRIVELTGDGAIIGRQAAAVDPRPDPDRANCVQRP
jgi:hypothetical protein